MNTTQVRCFLRVAETHSFTKAASALYLTQQSVSRQIALLEEDIGTQLLDRTTPYITLTSSGQLYYNLLSTASRQLAQLKEEMAGSVQRLNRRLQVGISHWLNPFGELGEAIHAFRLTHPDTAVELMQLDNEMLSDWFSSGRLDAAFFSEGQFPHTRQLHATPVAAGEMCLFAPADVVEGGNPEGLSLCWGLPMLMVPAWEWSYLERKLVGDQEQLEFGLHPPKVLCPPNLHSLEAALRFGRCVTVGDRRFGVFQRIPGLAAVPLPLGEHLMLAWPAGREHPLLEEFRREVEGFLGDNEENMER